MNLFRCTQLDKVPQATVIVVEIGNLNHNVKHIVLGCYGKNKWLVSRNCSGFGSAYFAGFCNLFSIDKQFIGRSYG